MQNPQQQFEKELRDELEAIEFPLEAVPDNFHIWLKASLYNESKQSIGCDMQSFVVLHDYTGGTLNVFVMGFAINTVEKQTPKSISGQTIEDFITVIGETTSMGKKWNEIVLPIRNRLIRKAQALADMGGRNGKIIKPGHR